MTTAVPAELAAAYPANVEARLDEPLSRWKWLVKWFLAIPHYIVLVFLWLAFVLLTIVAFFAILFTGRYPRGIFDFNVGVMRWTWRVSYYSTTGLGTDRYPPFSLGAEPDYPATLDVEYPERLSHWKPLVKWLFAIPQLIIVGLFMGGGGWSTGLVGILTLVADRHLRVPAGLPARDLQARRRHGALVVPRLRVRRAHARRVPAVQARPLS